MPTQWHYDLINSQAGQTVGLIVIVIVVILLIKNRKK